MRAERVACWLALSAPARRARARAPNQRRRARRTAPARPRRCARPGAAAFTVYRVFGIWLYPFLDASQPWAPAAYAGIYSACWAFFGVVALEFRARAWLFRGRRALKLD